MATSSAGVDTLHMRAALLIALAVLLGACLGATSAPSPSPSAPPSATATPTASAAPSSGPPARQVRPFVRTQAIAIAGEPIASDRARAAYVGTGGELRVVELATGAQKTMHTPQAGWHLGLDPHGLRGATLVFSEGRTDGQRNDVRVMRLDLVTGMVRTLDEFSGPFLGSGDTWRPRAPVTNGSDVLWVRVDETERPFLVSVVLGRAGVAPVVVAKGQSAVWTDLDDAGRVAVSTLITADQVAELIVWHDGRATSLGDRPSRDGGPAAFVGGRVFWAIGPGVARPITSGALLTLTREARALDLGCPYIGHTARYLLLTCGSGTPTLLDPLGDERITLPVSPLAYAADEAIAWREGSQWWLGILAP